MCYLAVTDVAVQKCTAGATSGNLQVTTVTPY